MTIHVVFRVDASFQMGYGHVMRCLALAEKLRYYGATCRFVSAKLQGNLISHVRSTGFIVDEIEQFDASDWEKDANATLATIGVDTVDWVIVDHYGLDHNWEAILRTKTTHMMVIDDLADRYHDCDMLLDHNLGRRAEDYSHLIDSRCELLLGPSYALIRDEFMQQRAQRKSFDHTHIKKVLVSLGGADSINATSKVISELENLGSGFDAEITVILGANSPWLDEICKQASKSTLPIEVIVNPQQIGKILSENDIAIGAAGVSALERCCIGLPSLLIVTAPNQRSGAMALHGMGAACCIGGLDTFRNGLRDVLQNRREASYWRSMSARAQEIVDGEGCARAAYLISRTTAYPKRRSLLLLAAKHSSPGYLRPAQVTDLKLIFSWRNHPDIKYFMRSSTLLDWDEHVSWFKRKKANGEHVLLFEIADITLGFVHFKRTNNPDVVEWGFYTAPDAPRGTGRRMCTMAILYIFQHTAPDQIIGNVKHDNLRSQRLHEILGFRRTLLPSGKEKNPNAPLISFSLFRTK